MRSQSHCLSVIHHQYLVCKLDGGSSLGNNKYGFISLQITQCGPQARIGGKIQCRCTVIENQNLRIFYNGTGNRQTLLLSAGEISSALFNHIIQTAFFSLYHIRCLSHFNRMPQLFLCRIRISPAQILCNRSLKQYGFLHDNTNALPQIRKLRPDILITDIKMPFMDGLALSKLVCAELPETRIILISGHNDFEFAQEAIEIGVEQYLLKPVTKTSLLKTLEDVSRKIDEEREQKAYLRQFQQEGQEYEQYARRKFFEQITSGTLRVSEIYEQAKKLQIDIDAEGYNVILLTLQSKGTAEYSQTLAERLEELMAYLLRYGEYLLFRCNLMTYCVIVKGSAAGLDAAVHCCLENIQRRCGGDEALAWYAAVSEPVARLSELPSCYAKAHTILSYRHLLPERHVLTADVLQKPQRGALPALDEVDASKADPAIIRNFLQTGMREEIPDFVSEYLASFGNALDSMLFRQYVLLELRFSAIRAVNAHIR